MMQLFLYNFSGFNLVSQPKLPSVGRKPLQGLENQPIHQLLQVFIIYDFYIIILGFHIRTCVTKASIVANKIKVKCNSSNPYVCKLDLYVLGRFAIEHLNKCNNQNILIN